jgi:hypothetical protein
MPVSINGVFKATSTSFHASAGLQPAPPKATSTSFYATKKAIAGENEEGSAPSLKKFSFNLHADQWSVVKAAMDKVKQESGTNHDGTALEYISVDYIASPAPHP